MRNGASYQRIARRYYVRYVGSSSESYKSDIDVRSSKRDYDIVHIHANDANYDQISRFMNATLCARACY